MQATITQEPIIKVETRLAGPFYVTPAEYFKAQEQAKRKLARIIEREGDADGERLKPYYLEQLIAEAIRENSFSLFTTELYRLITMEKKEKPTAETAGNS